MGLNPFCPHKFCSKLLLGLEPMAPIRPQLLVSHANHSATEISLCMYVCYVCMYCMYVRTYVCIHVCACPSILHIYIHIPACVHSHNYIHTYTRTYVRTYIHTYTQTLKERASRYRCFLLLKRNKIQTKR